MTRRFVIGCLAFVVLLFASTAAIQTYQEKHDAGPWDDPAFKLTQKCIADEACRLKAAKAAERAERLRLEQGQ